MARLMLTSDLHLGHKNICKFRKEFTSPEEHHNFIYDNLASNINKRDSVIFLGDIAFNAYWLQKIKELKCKKKMLILGNHDTDQKLNFKDLVGAYDEVHSLYCKSNIWYSHVPIHPQEFRGRNFNIHGHLHDKMIRYDNGLVDERYINVCVEHTDYKPICLEKLLGKY